VFENRAAQSGRKIDLRVGVIKARGTHPTLDPIFWLAGGPGGAATEDASYAMQILGSANEQRDLVFVDQRGTGGSNKLDCPRSSDSSRQVEDLRACLDNLGSDPSAYTTAWAIDDLDDVRSALGYDHVNLYGESYGATAAQVYILRHDDHVRTATLVGGTLLDLPIFERFPLSSQQALEMMFARCEADASCHSAYPNLRQEFVEVLARLERGSVKLPINDPWTGQSVLLTRATLSTGIHGLVTGTETTTMLPQLIHMIYNQDWNGVAAFIDPFVSRDTPAAHWIIMNLTILCHEDWAKTRQAETTALSSGSYLRYSDVRALTVPEDICAAMPQPEVAALYGPVTDSSVPVLLVNGEADPQDPPENVAGANQRYPNSLTLVAPGQGHGYTGISCRASIIADFIADGSVSGLSTECLEQVALPAFDH
jgi:pimeloyl-ACP methyl ester carboxylesterase